MNRQRNQLIQLINSLRSRMTLFWGVIALCLVPGIWPGTGALASSPPPVTNPSPGQSTPIAQDNQRTRPTYEIHQAPFAWWRQLMQQHRPGIIMTYSQWLQHWAALQAILRGERDTRSVPPLLQQLHITGKVQGNQLQLQLQLQLTLLARGWQFVPLPLEGVGLASFQLKGIEGTLLMQCPTAAPCRPDQKRLWLAVRGPATGSLALQGGTRIRKTPQGRAVRFQFPAATASTLRLQLPGQQELHNPLKSMLLQRRGGTTWITGSLNGASQLKLLYRPLEAGTQQKIRLATRGETSLTLHPQFQWLSATLALHDRMGQRGRYIIDLPKGFRLLSLRAPQLEGIALDTKRHQLHVRLRPAQGASTHQLKLRLVRQGALSQMTLTPIGIQGAYSQTGSLSVFVHRSIKARIARRHALERIAAKVAKSGQNGASTLPDALQMRFRYWQSDSHVELALRPVEAKVELHPTIDIRLAPRQATMTIAVALSVTEGRLLALPWLPPAGWQLSQLSDGQQKALRYQRQGKRYLLQLPRPLTAGQSTTLTLVLLRRMQLPQTGKISLSLPSYQIPETHHRTGLLRIHYPLFYNGHLRNPKHLQETTSQGKQQPHQTRSFVIQQPNYQGSLELTRKTVRMQMLTMSHYQLQPAQLKAQMDVYIDIRGSSIHTLPLRVLRKAGDKLQFRARRGRIVEQHKLSQDGPYEVWQLKFARERFGLLAFEVLLHRELKEGPQQLTLPSVHGSAAIETEQSFVAVSTTPHMQIKPHAKGLNPLDPSMLPAPLFGTWKTTPVLAYHTQQRQRSLSLELQPMAPKRLLSALIRQLQIKAQLQAQGQLRVRANLLLQSKGIPAFEASLPPHSELWGATLNGKGIKPMRQGNQVRIPLPPHDTAQYNIALHYTTKSANPIQRVGTLQAQAPQFSYPVQQTYWSLHTPADTVAFAHDPAHPIFGAQEPRPLLLITLRYLRRHPAAIALLLGLLLLFVLRTWIGRLFGAAWALLQTVFQLCIAFIRYLFQRWYRWSIALVCGLLIGGLFLSTAYRQLESKSAPLYHTGNRFSRLIMPSKPGVSAGSSSTQNDAPARKSDSGGARYYRQNAHRPDYQYRSRRYGYKGKKRRSKKRSRRRSRRSARGPMAKDKDMARLEDLKQAYRASPEKTIPLAKTPRVAEPNTLESPKSAPQQQAMPPSVVRRAPAPNVPSTPPPPPPGNSEQKPVEHAARPEPTKEETTRANKTKNINEDDNTPDVTKKAAQDGTLGKPATSQDQRVLQNVRRHGLLGLLGSKQGGKANNSPIDATTVPKLSDLDRAFGKSGQTRRPVGAAIGKEQRRQQKQRMLQWMMRTGEGRMMRGIRSIDLAMPVLGAYIGASAAGLMPSLQLVLWHHDWLRWFMLLCFLASIGLGLVLAWRLPTLRRPFFWGGLLLTGVAGILLTGTGILFANAATLGVLLAGLLVALGQRRKQDPSTPPAAITQASSKVATIALAFVLGGASLWIPLHTTSAHAAPVTQPTATPAKSGPCILPFAMEQSHTDIKLPGHTARLFVPYARGQAPGVMQPTTPVFVPHQWWMLLRGLQPHCQRLPASVRAWLQAHYALQVKDATHIHGKAHFRIRLLTQGWHRIALGLQGARLHKQEIVDGLGKTCPGHIRYRNENDGYEAILQGPGTVSIRLQLRLRKQANKKKFSLQVGPALAATMSVTIPGKGWRVTIPQATGGISSHLSEKYTHARALLGQRDQATALQIGWQTTQQDDAARHEAAQAFETTHISLRTHLLRLRTKFALSYRFRRSDRFSFLLPKGTILERLVVPKMRRWYLKDRKDGSRELTIRLHRPTQRISLELQTALLRQTKKRRYPLPMLQPLGVSQHTGIVGIRSNKGLQMALLGADGLEKRSPSDYAQSTGSWGGRVQEAYAYRRQPTLSVILRRHKAKPNAICQLKVAYTNKQTRLRAHIQYTNVARTRFMLAFALDPDLQLSKVETLFGAPVHQYWLGPIQKERRTLFVELKAPLQPGQRLVVEAHQTHKDIANIPLFVPLGTKQLQGTLLLYVPQDIEAQTERSTGLDPIEVSSLPFQLDQQKSPHDSIHYKHEHPNSINQYTSEAIEQLQGLSASAARLSYQFVRSYQGRLQLRKEVTTTQCEGEIALQLEEHTATIDVSLRFQATGAGQRQWSFSVPAAIASQLQWQQKPTNATLRRHKPADGRVLYTWQQLQPSTQSHIAFQYRLPIPKSGKVSLGHIAPQGASHWKLRLLLKKGSHIRIHLPDNLDKDIDKLSLGALPATLRTQHKDLIAAYALKTNDWQLTARREILRTAIALQPTVELAKLETNLTSQGQAWTQATYTLRSPGRQTLTLHLPAKATLWQVTVAGRDLRPAQGTDGSYILPLPPKQTSDLAYPLQILYAHPLPLPSRYGSFALHAPKLDNIDTAETFWTVRIPNQYKVAWDRGNMEPTLQFHIATQELKSAIDFAQKLKKMAAVGTRQQQWRAQRNLIQQQQNIRQQLSHALRAQRVANRRRYNSKKQNQLNLLNTTISDLKQSAGDLLRAPASTPPTTTTLDPTAHWKQQFHLQTHAKLDHTQTQIQPNSHFVLHRKGKPTTYVTVGGSPQLELTIYHRKSLQRTLGWFGCLVLLLLSLFLWRKFSA